MRQIPVIEANAVNFEPYGQLIETPKTDPTMQIGFKPDVATYLIEGETEVCVWSGTRHDEPLVKMERHLKTPELFVVIEGDFILPLAEPMSLDDPNLQPSVEDVIGLRVTVTRAASLRLLKGGPDAANEARPLALGPVAHQ